MSTTGWAGEHLGIDLSTPAADSLDPTLSVGVALRRNAKRAHLLVSNLLGKHVPAEPRLVLAAAHLLGARVRAVLDPGHPEPADALPALAAACTDTDPATRARALAACAPPDMAPFAPDDVLVIGFAETATGLGFGVADALGAHYLHSTRREVPATACLEAFREDHSHAPGHLMLPENPGQVTRARRIVLVDDEFSTGATAMNVVRALVATRPRQHVVLASLLDARPPTDRARLTAEAAALGVRLDTVTLTHAHLTLPTDLLDVADRLRTHLTSTSPRPTTGSGTPAPVHRLAPRAWPTDLRESGRHGVSPTQVRQLRDAVGTLGAQLAEHLATTRPPQPTTKTGPASAGGEAVFVCGSEELMFAPQLLALALAERSPGAVRVWSTTRSPVQVVDDPGYPIRSVLHFPAPEGVTPGADGTDPGVRHLHNVAEAEGARVVLVVDEPADTPALHAPDGLVEQLRRHCRDLTLVVLPSHRPRPLPTPLHGPEFGSYPAQDVTWLLKDLSGVPLEAETALREKAIQSGRAHYAQSLPIEYQPGERYRQLFEAALAEGADRLAHAVGVVAEQVLAARGPDVALVSLARAGTPVGVLVRRWLRARHGVEAPHLTVSIVRGRGIDRQALRYVAAHHRPRDVVFVDGWTGKGAITRELAQALADEPGFDPRLAVLADPGHCSDLFGTREDFLIPSACLNSTVSGLVSRTVLNEQYLGPDDFHGAKCYRELAAHDVSNHFVDTVTARFDAVADDVARDWPTVAARAAAHPPQWLGQEVAARLAAECGVGDLNLVKPGVGETTRVLLRRVPWQVRVAPGAPDLAHVLLLAQERGVPVIEDERLGGYRCVGLIKPTEGDG